MADGGGSRESNQFHYRLTGISNSFIHFNISNTANVCKYVYKLFMDDNWLRLAVVINEKI